MFASVEKQQIKVPAHIDYLGDLRDFVTQIGHKHRFSDKVVNAFKLAVDEAATNIIRHAYREKEGLITIRAIAKKNSLTLSIIDQGTFFDPKRVKDPDLNRYIDIGKKGGLGIFIMRKLMDDIDYRRTDEGNELRISKSRDPQDKKGFLRSVSTIPFSIKAKYFFRAITIITATIATGYLFFFMKTDDEILSEFLSESQLTGRQIVNLISSASKDNFTFIDVIADPINEEYQEQVSRISIEDSTGFIVYSSNPYEIGLEEFKRPKAFEEVFRGIYKYQQIDGETFYELESPIIIKETGEYYGKAHILFSAQDAEERVVAKRMADLQLALVILGVSCAGVVILIYLVMNPFRKLSEWVKNMGNEGEIGDDVDIDASTEIGEIAKAFSEITHKFRDSQKNLADQERLQKEMQVAQEIQQTLLPMEFPELEGYQLSAFYEAAKEVGGDYYDFVEVDKDTLGIAVADVSGKGVPGSLVMTMIRTALRTEARGLKDAAEVLSRVNAFVANDIKKGMFVTVFYLIIDSKKRRLNYASAGHNPMILYRGSTEKTYYLNPKGFPIGVQLPDKDYFKNYIQSDTIQLTKDDILLLYTDGITEAMNSRRELFGEERLQHVLREHGDLSANQFVEKLKDSIYSFTEGAPQYDDITLVTIKEEYTRQEDELRRAKEVYELITGGLTVKDACESANLSTHAYYNKYKKVFEQQGADAYEVDESISVESKHVSIEDKTKIFDIIQNHPEYGAGRIRDELNTEKYQFTRTLESRIYEELVRNRLNTRALREAYLRKAKRGKRRIKTPGTPFMTLDGQLVVQELEQKEYGILPEPEETPSPEPRSDVPSDEGAPAESPGGISIDVVTTEPASGIVEEEIDDLEANDLLTSDLQDVLANRVEPEPLPEEDEGVVSVDYPSESQEAPPADDDGFEELFEFNDVETAEVEAETEAVTETREREEEVEEQSLTADISFEDLFGSDAEPEVEDDFAPQEQEESQEFVSAGEAEFPEEESGGELENVENLEDLLVEDPEAPFGGAVTDENEHEFVETGADDDSVSASSTDELLGEDHFAGTDLFPSEESESEVPESAAEPELEEEQAGETDLVSFSDLIRAIDDDLVYVAEPPSRFADTPRKQSYSQSEEESPQSAGLNGNGNSAGNKTDPPVTADAGHDADEYQDDTVSKEMVLINGIKYYKNNDYERAIEEFRRVIDIYPDYKEAHSILGNAYFRNKMYREAAVEYERVKDIDPNDITAYENMGVIYANRGNFKDAVFEWKRIIELNPDRTDIQDKIRKALRMM